MSDVTRGSLPNELESQQYGLPTARIEVYCRSNVGFLPSRHGCLCRMDAGSRALGNGSPPARMRSSSPSDAGFFTACMRPSFRRYAVLSQRCGLPASCVQVPLPRGWDQSGLNGRGDTDIGIGRRQLLFGVGLLLAMCELEPLPKVVSSSYEMVVLIICVPSASNPCIHSRKVCNSRVSLRCLCALSLLDAFSITLAFGPMQRAPPVGIIASCGVLACYSLLSITVSGFHRVAIGAVNLLLDQLSISKASSPFRRPAVLPTACSYHNILMTTDLFSLISLGGAIASVQRE